MNPARRRILASIGALGTLGLAACSKSSPFVPLPVLPNGLLEMRVAHAINPRLPRLTDAQLTSMLAATAATVKAHFGVDLKFLPAVELSVKKVMDGIPAIDQEAARRNAINFKSANVDMRRFELATAKMLQDSGESFEGVAQFARATMPDADISSFDTIGAAAAQLHLQRLQRWLAVPAFDGAPAINSSPYNEFGFWDFCGRGVLPFEMIVTNQLIVSAEFTNTSIHTAVRGGYTNGIASANRSSKYGSAAIWSTFAFLSEDPWVVELRQGERYAAEEAVKLSGICATHEIGHQLFHYGHPYLRPECVMAPVRGIAFRAAAARFDAAACARVADPHMRPGTVKIPIAPQ